MSVPTIAIILVSDFLFTCEYVQIHKRQTDKHRKCKAILEPTSHVFVHTCMAEKFFCYAINIVCSPSLSESVYP